jgi:hypothetical protein
MRRASASPVSLPHHSPHSNDVDGRSPQYEQKYTPAGKVSAVYNGLGIAAANAPEPYFSTSAYVDRTSGIAGFGTEEESRSQRSFPGEDRKVLVPSSAYSERGLELIPQELHDYYAKMNTSHHSPPAHPAHSAPPVRPAFSTGIPSIAPRPSSFTRIDSAA